MAPDLADSDPLGAFVPGPRVEREGATEGPLVGLTFAAKDNFDVAGAVSVGGNPDWPRGRASASRNAIAVERLLAAGARLAGKTVMDELAFGSLGQNEHYGTPLNSAAPDRVPGGSSSGSASAVAGSAVDFALGTDSACSVRLPAGVCGIYGIRPTHGRVPVGGVIPLSPSLDTVGWFARSAEHMGRIGAVLLDEGSSAPAPERILLPDDVWPLAAKEVTAALAPAREKLAGLDGPVEHITIGEPDTPRAFGHFLMRQSAVQIREAWQCFGEWIELEKPRSSILTRENLKVGADSTPEEMAQARADWAELRAQIRERIPAGTICVFQPRAVSRQSSAPRTRVRAS